MFVHLGAGRAYRRPDRLLYATRPHLRGRSGSRLFRRLNGPVGEAEKPTGSAVADIRPKRRLRLYRAQQNSDDGTGIFNARTHMSAGFIGSLEGMIEIDFADGKVKPRGRSVLELDGLYEGLYETEIPTPIEATIADRPFFRFLIGRIFCFYNLRSHRKKIFGAAFTAKARL